MNRLTLLASITLCALLLTACTLPGLSPDSKPQPTVQIAVTIYATTAPLATPVPAQSQTPVPALSPTPVPTAAPSAPSDCPPRVQSPGAPVKPATFTDTVASVVSVLNTGATSTETLELLKGWGRHLQFAGHRRTTTAARGYCSRAPAAGAGCADGCVVHRSGGCAVTHPEE